MSINFAEHLHRQAVFSHATFGPGTRTEGVIDHIRKELVEVENATHHADRLAEWADVVILALDGMLREARAWGVSREDPSCPIPEQDFAACANEVLYTIQRKQAVNEMRTWPDWRTADPSKAIEHDRSGES